MAYKNTQMKKKAAVILADGFEEVEALTPVDVLRRANIDTVTISVNGNKEVTGSHRITILADKIFEDIDFSDFDAIILPGGLPGANNLNSHEKLKETLVSFSKKGKILGAICAAPLVLGEMNLLQGKNAVCYPGFEKHLKGAKVSDNQTVKDNNIITGIGIGASMQFALSLVEELTDKKTADDLANKMMVKK